MYASQMSGAVRLRCGLFFPMACAKIDYLSVGRVGSGRH